MSVVGGGINFMECLYIMLETGCSIKRLSLVSNQFTVIFSITGCTFTVSSHGNDDEEAVVSVIDKICEQLKSLNVISQNDWHTHIAQFYSSATHNKNIAIMKFILNATVSGWRVRKSFTRYGEYHFNRNHNGKRKYLSDKFLSRFLENNTLKI